jgi:hypothetical protein
LEISLDASLQLQTYLNAQQATIVPLESEATNNTLVHLEVTPLLLVQEPEIVTAQNATTEESAQSTQCRMLTMLELTLVLLGTFVISVHLK